MKIRTKLLVFFIPLTVIPILIIGYLDIANHRFMSEEAKRISNSIDAMRLISLRAVGDIRKSIDEKTFSDYTIIAGQLKTNIDLSYGYLSLLTQTLAGSTLLDPCRPCNPKDGDGDRKAAAENLYTQLASCFGLHEISVIDSDGNVLIPQTHPPNPPPKPPSLWKTEGASPRSHAGAWERDGVKGSGGQGEGESVGVQGRIYFEDDSGKPQPVLSFCCPITCCNNRAFLNLAITIKTLAEPIIIQHPEFKGNIILTDSDDNIIFDKDSSCVGERIDSIYLNHTDYFVIRKPILDGMSIPIYFYIIR